MSPEGARAMTATAGKAVVAGDDGILRLAAGPFSAMLAPAVGGSIAAFRWSADGRTIELLRPAAPEAIAAHDARGAACFPMVPFASLLVSARFAFQGREYQLAHNFPGRDVALHGDGWQSQWTVEALTATSAVLVHRQHGERFPFAYEARQSFDLAADRLAVALTVTNTGAAVMPAGIGFHPFFPRTPDLELKAECAAWWRRSPDGAVTEKMAVPSDLDFSQPRRVADIALQDFFAGWNGRARLRWPAAGVEVELEAAAPLGTLLLFSPPDRDILCVEPVSQVADGFNRLAAGHDDSGVTVLAPGESLTGRMTLGARVGRPSSR